MPRPKKKKNISLNPRITYFKPQGIPLKELKEIFLSMDELEALNLSDYLSFSQIEAAKKMGIHQSTFNRILCSARKKISKALIEGKALGFNTGD